MTQPLWLKYCQTVSARSLALLVCDAVLRPRREDNELGDWVEQRRPASCQTVAGDIGTALRIPGADRRERKRMRDTVGMELLNIAFFAGLIAKLQSGVKGLAAPCVLSEAAQGQLAEIYTALVLSGDLLTEQPVFDRPAPIVDMRPNWRGYAEPPANDSAEVIEAVDAMQSTAWRVNQRMLSRRKSSPRTRRPRYARRAPSSRAPKRRQSPRGNSCARRGLRSARNRPSTSCAR